MAGEMTPWLERGREKRDGPAAGPAGRPVHDCPGPGTIGKGPRPASAAPDAAPATGRVCALRLGGRLPPPDQRKTPRPGRLSANPRAAGNAFYVDTGPVLERDFRRGGRRSAGTAKARCCCTRNSAPGFSWRKSLTTLDLESGRSRSRRAAEPAPAVSTPARPARSAATGLTPSTRGSAFLTSPSNTRARSRVERCVRCMGDRIYGCDDCLDTCPWNRFAQASREAAFQARPATAGHGAPGLSEP